MWEHDGRRSVIHLGLVDSEYSVIDEAVFGDRPLRFHILEDDRVLLAGINGVYLADGLDSLASASKIADIQGLFMSTRGPDGLVLLDISSNLMFMALDGTVTKTVPLADHINALREELGFGARDREYLGFAADKNGIVYLDLEDYGFMEIDATGEEVAITPVELMELPGSRNYVFGMAYSEEEHALYLAKAANDAIQRYDLTTRIEDAYLTTTAATGNIFNETFIYEIVWHPDGGIYYVESAGSDLGRYAPNRMRQRMTDSRYDDVFAGGCALRYLDFLSDGTPVVSCQELGGERFRFARVDTTGGRDLATGAKLTRVGTEWLLERADQRRRFDAEGQLVERQTANGTETFVYGANGIASYTDVGGDETRFTYTSGRLSRIDDDAGRTYDVVVDGDGDLVSLTDGDGVTSTFAYTDHLMTSRAVDGNEVRYAYDAGGAVTSATLSTGEQRSFRSLHQAAAATGIVAQQDATSTFTDGAGSVTRVTFGPGGARERVELDGVSFAYEYDVKRSASTSLDSTETTVTVGVDEFLFEENAEFESESMNTFNYFLSEFDELGRRTSLKKDGRSCYFTYDDAVDRLSSFQCDYRLYWEYSYDSASNLTGLYDYDSNLWGVAFDSDDNLTSVTYPSGGTAQLARDAAGLVTRIVDPEGRATELTRDASGNVVGALDEGGGTATFTYARAATCPGCSQHGQDVLSSVTDANANTWTYAVRADGLYSAVTNPLGQQTKIFTWDERRNLTGVSADGSPGITLERNAFGQATSMTVDNDTRSFLFDGSGRLTEVGSADFRVARVYDDDVNDPLMTETVTDLVTGVSMEVTVFAKPDNLKIRGFRSSAGHDYRLNDTGDDTFTGVSASQTPMASTSVSWSAGVSDGSYAYDPDGNTIVSVSVWTDELRRISTRDVYAGVNSDVNDALTYTYADTRPWIEGITASAGTLFESVTYTRDALGRVTGVSGDVTASYTYDAAGRITSSSYAGPFTYDAAGRLLTTSLATYTYEPRGTRRSRGVAAADERWEYTFDAAEQLVRVEKFSPRTAATPFSTVDLGYDPLGRLTRIDVDGTITHLMWLDHVLLAELDGAGDVVRRYVPGSGADQVAIVQEAGVDYYVIEDHMGSVYRLVDANGQTAARYSYDPYGRVLVATGALASQPRRFHGAYYLEAIGHYYFRARWYDPEIGQFISEDPEIAVNPYPHPYLFANDDPTLYTDSSGASPDGTSNTGDFVVSTTTDSWSNGAQFAPGVGRVPVGAVAGGVGSLVTFGGGIGGHKRGNSPAVRRHNAYNDAKNYLKVTKLWYSPVMRKLTLAFMGGLDGGVAAAKLARLRVLGPCNPSAFAER